MKQKLLKMIGLILTGILFVFAMNTKGVKAEEPEGTAYGVLQDNGDLILIRSTESAGNTSEPVDITDIHDVTYHGIVIGSIESEDSASMLNGYRDSVQNVYVAENTTIDPVNMYHMFMDCTELSSVDLNGFDGSAAVSMEGTFKNCPKLESIDFGTLNTSNVTTMYEMFKDCSSLKYADLSSLDTSKVEEMSYLFNNCVSLTDVVLTGVNTQNVRFMYSVFDNCQALAAVDLSSFNTSNVDGFNGLFDNCSALREVTLGENFIVWPFAFDLPRGTWVKGDIRLPAYELINQYAQNPSALQGTWKLDPAAYGILQDNGDLVFIRTFDEVQSSSEPQDITDMHGNVYTGEVIDWSEDEYVYILGSRYSSVKNVYVAEDTEIYVKSLSRFFENCDELISVDLHGFNTSEVTDMSSIFDECRELESVDFGNIDTSNVTNMRRIFFRCFSLTSVDLSGLDTSSLEDIEGMFLECTALTDVNLTGFNTQNVTEISYLFEECESLQSVDLSSFDTSSIESGYGLFEGCDSLTEVTFGENFTLWTGVSTPLPDGVWIKDGHRFTRNELIEAVAQDPSIMHGTWTLEPLAYGVEVNGDLIFIQSRDKRFCNDDIKQDITDINGTAYNGYIIVQVSEDGSVGSFGSNKQYLKHVYVAEGQTVYLSNTSFLFEGCFNLITADLRGFNTYDATDMSYMFKGCTNLTEVNLSGLDTSNVTNMRNMFYQCSSLENVIFGDTFDTSGVTDMSQMFYECTSLESLDVSSFDTSNVTDMGNMFCECTSLESLDVSSFDTSNVTSMGIMFDPALRSVTLGEGFTVWNADATLCRGLWSDGEHYYSESELRQAYVQNPAELQGTWTYQVAPSRVTVSPSYLDLQIGEESQLSANVFPADAYDKTVTWTSDNPEIASVDDTGLVTAVTNGTAVITAATVNGYSTSCTVTVHKPSQAYAVLQEDGDLIFFRSEQTPIDTSEPQDIRDINGKLYTGTVFSGIEENCTDFITGIRDSVRYVHVAKNQTIVMPDNMGAMFSRCANLISADLNGFDTSAVTDMHELFSGCTKLTSVNLTSFNTSNVQNMHGMFKDCNSIMSLNLAGFDTSGVNDMAEMFSNCHQLTSLDLSGFDTSAVYTMRSMFMNCINMKSLNVTGFDTSNVTDMTEMFMNSRGLTSLDVSSFDTSNVTGMSGMFGMDSGLRTLNLGSFNTSKVTSMSRMFESCSNLTELNVSSFDTSNVTRMSSMFSGCFKVAALDVSGFDTSKVTDMGNMFASCQSLTSLDVSGFNTSGVTDMAAMFSDCRSLTSLDVSGFDISNTQYIDMMFGDCIGLTSLDVSGWDTSNVIGMSSVFYNCSGLTGLDVTDFVTSNAIRMSGLFHNCKNVPVIDVSGFDTSGVTTMSNMFSGCTSLTELDLSGFNTEKVTDMSFMFDGCESLTGLDLSNFITDRVTTTKKMFNNCSSLTSLDLSSFNTVKATNMMNMFDGCSTLESVALGEEFTVWKTSAPLPAGIWMNGDYSYSEKDLITAYVQNPAGLQGTWTRARLPETIELSAESIALDIGTGTQLTCTITPDTADIKTVTWTSSNTEIASVDADGNVTGVSAGTAEITATTVNGLTAVCTVTVKDDIIPGIPQNLTAKNYASTGNIKLTWEAAENAYKYQVYRATSSSGDYTRIATTENTYYIDTTGENGQTYYYKVRSMTENSTYSKYSSKKSIKCVETVLVLTAKTDTASGSPVLSWNTAEDLKYYQLYRSENDGVTYTKLLNTTSTSKTDSTAEAGKTYWYKVRAIDTESKSGTYSEPVSIEAIPAQPTGITTKNNPATGNIKVSWDDMADAYKYQVYRATSSDGTYTRIATTENTYYIDTTGVSGKTYYYKVRSQTEDSVYSKFSSKKSAKCSETVLTLTAKNSTTNGKPGLSWNSAGTVKYYQLYRATSENGTYTKIGNITGTSKSDSTAETGVTYWYKVRAIDTDGKSGTYSEPVSIVCKPARVTGLKAVNVSSTGKPKLTWTAVEDATKYQVYYSTSKDGTYKRLKETTSTSYTHTGAEAGTTYYYKVRAVTENGTYGAFSTIIS